MNDENDNENSDRIPVSCTLCLQASLQSLI